MTATPSPALAAIRATSAGLADTSREELAVAFLGALHQMLARFPAGDVSAYLRQEADLIDARREGVPRA